MRGSKARLVITAIVAASRFPFPRLYRSPGNPIGKSIDYLDFATIELPGPAYGLVSAICRASAIKALRPQQDRRPALPGRHDILRLKQIEQMAFGREDYAVARSNRGSDVIRLTGFLRDDDLIGHVACREEADSEARRQGT